MMSSVGKPEQARPCRLRPEFVKSSGDLPLATHEQAGRAFERRPSGSLQERRKRMNMNFLQRTTAGSPIPTHRQPNRLHQRFGQRVLAAWIPLLLVLLALSPAVQAQFTYTTNNDTITITGYTGPGGAVDIPGIINGLPVTSIGGSAFRDITNLTRVTIPNNVTNIGEIAFAFCSSLTDVTIPRTITSIGYGAFFYCTSLGAITVDPLNQFYSSQDGVLFNQNQTTLITYPPGKGNSYSIPVNTLAIGDSAFYYCAGLASVSIPNTVTYIDSMAFYTCFSLTNITIPGSVTNIGNYAFAYCSKLAGVIIPASVASIGAGAFTSLHQPGGHNG